MGRALRSSATEACPADVNEHAAPPLKRRPARLSPEAEERLRELHPEQRRRVRAAIESLRDDPSVGEPLRGELEGYWRLPVGRLRIIYRHSPDAIEVIEVGPRATIYEDFARRLRKGGGL